MNKKLFKPLKFLILVASLVYIIYKLSKEIKSIDQFMVSISGFEQFLWFFICIILMPLNWTMESVKWKLLITPIEKLSLKKCLKAVLSGVTTSIFLPNRVGEFAGRILHLEAGKRSFGILPTFIGNISQFSITVVAGLTGLIMINKNIELKHWFDPLLLMLIGTAILIFTLFVYFNPWLFGYFSGFFKAAKIKLWLQTIASYPTSVLILVVCLSALRYVIFILQFYAAFHFFGLPIEFLQVFFCISVVFLALAFLPILTISDLSVRGSLSILIIGSFGYSSSGILVATLLVWIVNLAIPAMVGGYFIWKTKLD